MTVDRAVAIAQRLIRFDTQNWGGGRSNGEREAAEFVAGLLSACGLQPELIESVPGRTSVVTRWAGSDPSLPALVLHGHLDVVPAVAGEWTVDPFSGEIRDGMLWGRGAVDMKNVVGMMLAAVETLTGAGEQPRRDIVLAFFADEENGGVYGSQHVVRTRPELFAGAEYAISEVGGYSVDVDGRTGYLVQTGEKALVWLTLTASGTAAHGSSLGEGNAITRLAEAVARIGRHTWPVAQGDTTAELLRRLENLSGQRLDIAAPDLLMQTTGTAARYLRSSLRTTANPTGFAAGYKHNVIPGTASATIDARCFPGEEEATIALVEQLAGPHVQVERTHVDIGFENPTESPMLDTIAALLDEHDPGAVVLPYLMSAGTDSKALSTLGITGYGFAPLKLPPEFEFMAMFHGVDERVPVEAVAFGRRVLTDLIRRA